MSILLVDGYNMIGDWPNLRHLRDVDFAKARDLLVDKMAEYQAYTGDKVFVVFDAYQTESPATFEERFSVTVIFTNEHETADERIEEMSLNLLQEAARVYVATSDWTEQAMIFTQGALRKSARELYTEVKRVEEAITDDVQTRINRPSMGAVDMPEDITAVFEKWRREHE